jgi:hypothetical protein
MTTQSCRVITAPPYGRLLLRPALGGESFDGLELLVDFRFGRAAVV